MNVSLEEGHGVVEGYNDGEGGGGGGSKIGRVGNELPNVMTIYN